MGRSVLIRGARQLLTLHGPAGPRRGDSMRQLGLIEDGAVLISNGIITNVGPTRRLENLAEARSAEEINATGRVLMPGFVDAHTHLIAAPPRTSDPRGSGAPFSESTFAKQITRANFEHIRRTSAPALEHQAMRLLTSCLRHGTTTIEVKSGWGLDESGEVKMLRVLSHLSDRCATIVPTFRGPHTPPPDFKGTLDDYLLWICEHMLPKLKSRQMAYFVSALCDASGFNVGQAGFLLYAARRLGLATKLHAEHTGRLGAVRMAVEIGATSLDGLEHIDAQDAVVLGQSRTIAVLLPGPIYPDYTSRPAPARMLIERGAAVALASGYHPPVASTYNMMTVLSIACANLGMTPEEAITAATINGAHALARSNQCGSLEFGKDADLILLNVSDYREIPYLFGVNLVSMTMRKGKVVFREGTVECSVN